MVSCSSTKVLGCDAGKLDICIQKGDSFVEEIKWVEDVNGKSVPKRLRGYSAKLTVVNAHNTKNEIVLELESPVGISLDNNKIIIDIPYTISNNFNWKKGNYKLTMLSPQNIKSTILKGKFIIAGSTDCCN